jgi:lipoprotein-anchoring transpeptidase ErfK/SrfK
MAIAEDSKMVRVGGHGASVGTGRLWRIALLTLAGAIGTASEADAALYYWSGYDSGYYYLPPPTVPQRRPRVRRHQTRKIEAPEKESAKPQGPLILAISIERQSLKIYDANGFFAETPISTGMRGHPTPMGVFSVIQKHKFHHSNIYSGAPMPYMQRITWSGVAMHAGVLPGYPASHGCIRMPMAFAVKMWNWTKMGARVVVTPGEITPASFSHPLLAARRVVPKPVAANEPQADAPPAAKTDMAADADATPKPVTSEASLELRSTVGHDDGVKPVIAERAAATPLRVQTHTVYASGDMPAAKASVTMSDAAPSGGNASPRDAAAAASGSAPSITTDLISVKSGEASNTEVKSEAAKSETAKLEAEPATARRGEIASTDDNPAETKSSETQAAEIQSAETDASDKKQHEVAIAAHAGGDAAKLEASANENIEAEEKAEPTRVEARADDVKTQAPKADAPKSSEKRDESIVAVTAVSPSAPDVKQDQARIPDKKAATPKPDPAAAATTPKRAGQIAVFISRKDSKLYVRQNFAALFDVPVTIAPSDRPLGTHVFTAQIDKDDASILHWSVVSLPVPARYAERRDEDGRASRRRKFAGAVEVKTLPMRDSPAEALDRLTIPADAMARIMEALSTGGSIIVSDQGITAGETGEGTDFIVSLR